MKQRRRGWRLTVALLFPLAATIVPSVVASVAVADPGVRVYPGMEIRQGDEVCTVGFVETRLRIAVAAGQCNGSATVTDRRGQPIGMVQFSRRSTAEDPAAYSPIDAVEYEVIRLSPNVSATDLLPNGVQLQSATDSQARSGLPVCHFGALSGQNCGRVSSVGNGRLVVPDITVAAGDVGGPVYTLTGDNRAAIVGLLDGAGRPAPEAVSWQAVMRQLLVDIRPPDRQTPAPAPGERTI